MSTKMSFAGGHRALGTVLATMAWLVVAIGWVVFAWTRHSFFQTLVGLGIAALLNVATIAALWLEDQGITLRASALTTLAGLTFVLYWIGFAWSGHTLLANFATLALSGLIWLGATVLLWVRSPAGDGC